MEPTRTGSQALTKLLAIIGFFAILALLLWLVVQGIRFFPSAFTSLASIAETVGGYRPNSELTIDTEKSIVNSGETFTLTWTDMGTGSYAFTYACAPGVILSVRAGDGTLREVPCNEVLTLTDDVHGLFVAISAREQRFSDVDFTLAFDAKKGDTHTTAGRVTVVNATVPTRLESDMVNTDTAEPIASAEINDMPDSIPLPSKNTPALATPPEVTPTGIAQTSQPALSVVSILPKSYEDGFVDIRAQYLGVGTLQNGTFVPKATFNKEDTAAFRFEVKNIGTKTSGTWTYDLTLPGNGTYTSDPQTGLTPNEKAIFTIGFELDDTDTDSVRVKGIVTSVDDKDTKNNDFDWSVRVEN